jgi:hypothetical protein
MNVRSGTTGAAALIPSTSCTSPAAQAAHSGQTAACARSEALSEAEISPSAASEAHIRARSQYREEPIIDQSDA